VGEQRLGERLYVAARQRAEEDELKELIVGERLGADLAEAQPQPLAVPVIVRPFLEFRAFSFARHGHQPRP
jgi:hypothetical protein